MSEDDFRAHARRWLQANAPLRLVDADPDVDGRRIDIVASKQFQSALHGAGLVGITWPVEYGGAGRTQGDLLVFNEEAASFELPTGPFGIGIDMCGPTILEIGTEEQRQRYVRPLVEGEEVWCQLFSEPGAGSDIAGLQARAVRDGDDWVINGQKVWTSWAHFADFGILIARTDVEVPKHRGLTMFIVDLHHPGVTVRALHDMTGGAHFNEVFFDDVRVPASAVLGDVDGGWQATLVTLRHERISVGTRVRSRRSRLAYDSLLELARARGRLWAPDVRSELADLYVREHVVGLFTARLRQEAQAGIEPGARGSVAKLASAELTARAAEVAVDVLGADVNGWADGSGVDAWTRAVNEAPMQGIAGGTNQIQRNIIAERMLGLPRDLGVGKDVPFRELRVNRVGAR